MGATAYIKYNIATAIKYCVMLVFIAILFSLVTKPLTVVCDSHQFTVSQISNLLIYFNDFLKTFQPYESNFYLTYPDIYNIDRKIVYYFRIKGHEDEAFIILLIKMRLFMYRLVRMDLIPLLNNYELYLKGGVDIPFAMHMELVTLINMFFSISIDAEILRIERGLLRFGEPFYQNILFNILYKN